MQPNIQILICVISFLFHFGVNVKLKDSVLFILNIIQFLWHQYFETPLHTSGTRILKRGTLGVEEESLFLFSIAKDLPITSTRNTSWQESHVKGFS